MPSVPQRASDHQRGTGNPSNRALDSPGRSPKAYQAMNSGISTRGTRSPSRGNTRVLHEEDDRTQTQAKGPSDAPSTTDHEARAPDSTDFADSQRDRAQNPFNTTRTCNKLPDVYM